jgi:hypothetical protein
VGTVPINVVYSNYQDVPGLGVKVPYTWVLTWTNGRGTFNVTSPDGGPTTLVVQIPRTRRRS